MTKQQTALLPLLRALRDGSRTAAEVATATGRSPASAHASLSAMAATAGRGRVALVYGSRGLGPGDKLVNIYSLTDVGRAKLAAVDGQIGART